MLTLIVILAPTLVLTVLRINAVMVLFALCLGGVLVQLAGHDAGSFITLFTANKLVTNFGTSLLLLLIPPVFAAIVLVGTVHGKGRALLNIVPALGVGLVGLLLAEPLLALGLRSTIEGSSVWHDLQPLQALTIGVVTVVSLACLLMQRPAHGSRSGKHHSNH